MVSRAMVEIAQVVKLSNCWCMHLYMYNVEYMVPTIRGQ